MLAVACATSSSRLQQHTSPQDETDSKSCQHPAKGLATKAARAAPENVKWRPNFRRGKIPLLLLQKTRAAAGKGSTAERVKPHLSPCPQMRFGLPSPRCAPAQRKACRAIGERPRARQKVGKLPRVGFAVGFQFLGLGDCYTCYDCYAGQRRARGCSGCSDCSRGKGGRGHVAPHQFGQSLSSVKPHCQASQCAMLPSGQRHG